MYVVDVIPFSRTAPAGTLSYRSRDALPEGSIVEVSLRRRMVQGLVVGCQSVAEAKATLKSASFMLAKTVPHTIGMLPDALRTAALTVAEYHAATLGSTLASLFGEHIRSDLSLADTQELEEGTGYRVETVEAALDSRAERYASIVEAHAGQATLLIVPTIAETVFWKDHFTKLKPLVLSSALSGKKREDALAASVSATSLVIATPSFSWTPIRALGSIIVERTGAGSYRIPKRPYLDMRIALRALAESRNLPLIYGDYPLPLEYRSDPAAAITIDTNVTIIDARREKPEEGSEAAQVAVDEPWTAIPKQMLELIGASVGAGGRALVLAVRKGYAPSVVCRDCGTTRTDEFGNVLTFTKGGTAGRVFRTVDGKISEQADVVCAHCGSWHLMPLGIGVERVEEELRAAFPDSQVIHFEGDTVRSAASAKKALTHAQEPGTIIVGTEAALPWLLATQTYPFEIAAVASADSLLALPFWRARERFVRLGLLLTSMSAQTVLGTRMPDDTAVRAVQDGTAFFAEETGLRKALGYPPFGTLLALQAEGTRMQLEKLDTDIRTALGGYTYSVLPDRALTRTVLRRSYVARLAQGTWPDPTLAIRLGQLPPSVRSLIDPESF